MTKRLINPDCPTCGSKHAIEPKMLLIGDASPDHLFNGSIPEGYRRKDQLAIDECLPSTIGEPPLSQFVDGFFCRQCGRGFLPDDVLRSN